jgi:alkylation response protein AidB-like acyl-CoA dehydrogenase
VPLIELPRYRDKILRIEVALLALEWSVLRVLTEEKTRYNQTAVAAVLKIRGSEMQQRIGELHADLLGTRSLRFFEPGEYAEGVSREIWPDYVPGKTANYMLSRASTIYGGTKEIQKNIIAKLAFGL